LATNQLSGQLPKLPEREIDTKRQQSTVIALVQNEPLDLTVFDTDCEVSRHPLSDLDDPNDFVLVETTAGPALATPAPDSATALSTATLPTRATLPWLLEIPKPQRESTASSRITLSGSKVQVKSDDSFKQLPQQTFQTRTRVEDTLGTSIGPRNPTADPKACPLCLTRDSDVQKKPIETQQPASVSPPGLSGVVPRLQIRDWTRAVSDLGYVTSLRMGGDKLPVICVEADAPDLESIGKKLKIPPKVLAVRFEAVGVVRADYVLE